MTQVEIKQLLGEILYIISMPGSTIWDSKSMVIEIGERYGLDSLELYEAEKLIKNASRNPKHSVRANNTRATN